VFAESGSSGARTNEIAKRAGVPQGLLYHYFENKEALFREVLDRALAPYFQATTGMLERAGRPTPGLLAGTHRLYVDFLQENPHVVRLMTWWQANEGWRRGLPIASGDVCHKPIDLGIQRIQQAQAAHNRLPDRERGQGQEGVPSREVHLALDPRRPRP
jgi:AcrR family transcriptional regulator